MAARGVRPSEIVERIPHLNDSTVYRVCSGATRDPWTNTLLAVRDVLDADLDALLGWTPVPLDGESRELLDRAMALDDEVKWLVVSILRECYRMRVKVERQGRRRRRSRITRY